MGIVAVLETADGKVLDTVEDPTNVLHRILPDAGDPKFSFLSSIDWYGDTVFNYLQAPLLLAEWENLQTDGSDEVIRVIEGIRKLVKRLAQERHVYLKFYGD